MAYATKIPGFTMLEIHARNSLLTPDGHEGF
jgi:hypothetical protein